MKNHVKKGFFICIAITLVLSIISCTDEPNDNDNGCEMNANDCQLFCEDTESSEIEDYPWGKINSNWDNTACTCDCIVSHCDRTACINWCLETENTEDAYCYFNECICEVIDGGLEDGG